MLEVLEHHMKLKTYQFKITYIYDFFFTKKVMSNMNAK